MLIKLCMAEKQKIYKPKPISGFPEWLPEERLVEQQWYDHIRKTFESYGFCSIETPSVEEIDVLLAKGEVDKEIYVLERLHKEEDDDKEARLALHFDQTVPFARYTAQHFNDLVFPFKRYQIQRVWRGERPQMGRMREFTQCDIDVINVDNLPLSFDAEIPAVIYEVLEGLNIGRVQLRISNRKILFGFLKSMGITDQEDITTVTRLLDKLEKTGEEEFHKSLYESFKDDKKRDFIMEGMGAFVGVARELRKVDRSDHKKALNLLPLFLKERNESLQIDPQLIEGIDELDTVCNSLSHLPKDAFVRDLSIVRGLDYYTGTVYETQLLDVPEFTGSVCSGGRYDDLASQYINKKLPGVGISIGFSRLFDVIRQSRPDLLKVGPKTPADIMVVLPNEEMQNEAAETARTLRNRGFKVEMYHAPQKLKKQLSYAEKKGIPFIWFPPFEKGQDHEVKDMTSGEQTAADPATWKKKSS